MTKISRILTKEQLEDIYFSFYPNTPEYKELMEEFGRLLRQFRKTLTPEQDDLMHKMFFAQSKMLKHENLFYISLGWRKRDAADK